MYGLSEALWHSVSNTLAIDVFKVSSLPARIIVSANAFVVLIIINTYTANLAAFLTVKQLDTSIHSVGDLAGKSVATAPTYVDRLYSNSRITATGRSGAIPNTVATAHVEHARFLLPVGLVRVLISTS